MSPLRRWLRPAVLLRILIGLLFVFAAVVKVAHSGVSGSMLGAVVGERIGLVYGLAMLEFALGWAFVLGFAPRLLATVAGVIVLVGLAAILADWIGGHSRPCGCFGEIERGLISYSRIVPLVRSVSLLCGLLVVALEQRPET